MWVNMIYVKKVHSLSKDGRCLQSETKVYYTLLWHQVLMKSYKTLEGREIRDVMGYLR